MKNTIIGLFALVSLPASAQFNGKLVYQIDQEGTRIVMTYIQYGTNAVITAYTMQLKNGVADTTTFHAQDTLIFDFTAATETHLQYKTWRAYKQKYMGTIMAAAVDKMPGTVSYAAAGSGSVNGYSCNHYVITTTTKFNTSKKDVWTTNDIGGSPTTWVLGGFLYYTPGFPPFAKLTAAGATGVVVQAGSTAGKLHWTMNLISCDPHFVPKVRGFFSVPSRYTLVDETNMNFSGN